jgi:hypothetical protein
MKDEINRLFLHFGVRRLSEAATAGWSESVLAWSQAWDPLKASEDACAPISAASLCGRTLKKGRLE